MSLEVLAGLVGRSPAWLSLIENGKRRLEKRSDIAALAEALDASATDLLGGPAPAVPFQRGRIVPARLREVLLDASLMDPPDMPVRPIGVVAAEWAGPILAARQQSDQTTLARLLPATIGELHVHAATAAGADQEIALRLLVDVARRPRSSSATPATSTWRGSRPIVRTGPPVSSVRTCGSAPPRSRRRTAAAPPTSPGRCARPRAPRTWWSRTSAAIEPPRRCTGCCG
ncbi:helix-turn-helix domain-containing protein [[Actinomadura] parvosata]|uniref:helix-turn-helix domain-containing protein n=1 Tax=[Actinomadura] parvosata TaxID=1955412 RepID=UPI001E2D8685|nr:helix-turn-helix transcriptional regulator [Nonomuraea sp. ATCC 55076]